MPSSSSPSSSSGPKKIITLTSFDGQRFEMEESAALQSKILGFMIDENCADDPIQIPLPRVTGDVLSKVVEYCNKHAQSGIDNNTLKAWYTEFVRLDASTLCNLVLASNFLEIESLLDLTCQVAADMIKGKTPDEIRRFFNVGTTATAEEEEAIRRENPWAFD